MAMKPEVLQEFKAILLGRREELLTDALKTVEGMSEMKEGKERYPDPMDRASLESDRNFLLRIRDRERKLIQKIDEALKRVAEGTFGVCENCGDEISEERLRARPVTTLCVNCKTEQEEQEKKRVF